MSLLDMIPERDRAELRHNLFASPEFHHEVFMAVASAMSTPEYLPFQLDKALQRHGFAPSNPEHAAALAASLAEVERVIAELERTGSERVWRFGPEVRALAGPLRSAVERLRGLK